MSDLYPFDADFIEVPFNARPDAENATYIYHRLRKPTLAEIIERENQIKYELLEINNREDQINADDEVANARFWDKLAIATKGYGKSQDWSDLTSEDKALMRSAHKSAAVKSMYAAVCTLEGDEGGISIGPSSWIVKQEIGVPFADKWIVRYTLREPTEAERVKFKSTSSSTSYVKGAKKSQVRVRTNIKAHTELFDALVEGIEGAVVNGHEVIGVASRSQFLAAIDPMWKRQVVGCLMGALEAQLSD